MADEEDIDFSSYLVDLDDYGSNQPSQTSKANSFGVAAHPKLNSPAFFSPPGAHPLPSATKSWAGAHAEQERQASETRLVGSGSGSASGSPAIYVPSTPSQPPSPPESASEASFSTFAAGPAGLSSTSVPNTAPSSFASSSFSGLRDASSSWGTQKGMSLPHRVAASPSSAFATPGHSAFSAMREQDAVTQPATNMAASSRSALDSIGRSSTSNTTRAESHSTLAGQSVPLQYDFAHNPLFHASTTEQPKGGNTDAVFAAFAPPSSMGVSLPTHFSTSLPATNIFAAPHATHRQGLSSTASTSTSVNIEDGFQPSGSISPSSGPQHVTRGHRSRQASTSSTAYPMQYSGYPASSQMNAAVAAVSAGRGSLPYTGGIARSAEAGGSNTFASKPYSRPPVGSGHTSGHVQNSSMHALSSRPSKRKTTPQAPTNSILGAIQTNQPGIPHNNFSPISPLEGNADSYYGFSSHTDASNLPDVSSSVPSERRRTSISHRASQAATSSDNSTKPEDAVRAALSAPSPFDLSNFDLIASQASITPADLAAYMSHLSEGAQLSSSKASRVNGVPSSNVSSGRGDVKESHPSAQVATGHFRTAGHDASLRSSVLGSSGQRGQSTRIPTPPGDDFCPPKAVERSRQGSVFKEPARTHDSADALTDFASFRDIPEGATPEELAARDPLATHLWRLYAKAKSGLPNGARMENITWRMMSLKLNKHKAASGLQTARPGRSASMSGPSTVPSSSALPLKTTEADAALQQRGEKTVEQRGPREEDQRGRRGRTAKSTSPSEDADVMEMDWRKQSRSRSRVPQGIIDGMDWRAQSRSRSRAPHMRLSMPSGPQGFQVPTYADIVETMESASRSQQDVSVGSGSDATLVAKSGPSTTSAFSSGNNGMPETSSFEATLKQLLAGHGDPESAANTPQARLIGNQVAKGPVPDRVELDFTQSGTNQITHTSHLRQESSRSRESAALDVSHKPPAEAFGVMQGAPSISMPAPFGVPSSIQQFQPSPDSGKSQSQKSISASVEGYLASLAHPTSVIDFPSQRGTGSIPGLFNEQELRANQHVEFGFLPKLVRKTSFDASYPAQLAHEEQKARNKAKRQRPLPGSNDKVPLQASTRPSTPSYATVPTSETMQQAWLDAANQQNFLINNYLREAAQSVPSTPSAFTPNFGYDCWPSGSFGNMPVSYSQGPLGASSAVPQAPSWSDILAFNSLHNSVGQPAAAPPPMTSNFFNDFSLGGGPGTIPPDLLALSSSTNLGHYADPLQMGRTTFAPSSFASSNEGINPPWSMTPPSSHPSPVNPLATPYTSPEEYANGEDGRSRSVITSRNSSTTNVPSLLAQSHAPEGQRQEIPTNAPPKESQITSEDSAAAQAGGDSTKSAPTSCVNCKTTNTPLWRRDENGQPLCNACQLFRKLHGSDRPVSLHSSVVKKRNRARNVKDGPKKTTSRTQRQSNATIEKVGV